MWKIVFSILVLIQGINNEASTVDIILDQLSVQLMRFGDRDNLFSEDASKLQAACDKYGEGLTKEKEKVMAYFKGVMLKIVEAILPALVEDARHGCKLLKEGHADKAVRVGKILNSKVEEAHKLRCSLITALTEAAKEDSKTTLPEVICYVKQFFEKSVALYSDNEEVKAFVVDYNKNMLGNMLEIMEKESKVKEPATCKLPEATSNPSEFSSINLPLMKAFERLEKK